tara:strand:+ start:503 stop:1171 length:669 start_codon:yes stop_codon:yes gene_type:complete
MALNKLKFNSLNVTPAAGKGIGFNSSADGLEATFEGGAMTFIKKLTASSSSTLSFVDGSSDVVLDSTYKEYIFIFNNIHLSANTPFGFQANAAGGSGYNETITSTSFFARHIEDADSGNSNTGLSYSGANDQAQGTSFQRLATDQGTGNDENMGGFLHLFNPSSTTFVKHFISLTQAAQASSIGMQRYVAGYFNTTSAIDEIQFKPESGNIDAGTITLYGIN